MTLPDERYMALNNTREFLRGLLDPNRTPRVPKNIRMDAYWCLKHYPTRSEISEISDHCPGIIARRNNEHK